MEAAIKNYNKVPMDGYVDVDYTNFNGTDLIVILGNAVNGSEWDQHDTNYFQNRWDMIMNVAIKYKIKVAFTLGDLDTKGNIKDPKKLI